MGRITIFFRSNQIEKVKIGIPYFDSFFPVCLHVSGKHFIAAVLYGVGSEKKQCTRGR